MSGIRSATTQPPYDHRAINDGVVGRYDVYQRHTRWEIPVVILEPQRSPVTTG